MSRRFRWRNRVVLLIVLAALLPVLWIVTALIQYRAERNAVAHMQKINPRTRVIWQNQTPNWLVQLGVTPTWMDRVTRVDATGVTCGKLKWEDYPKSQIDFGDEDLVAVADDLRRLRHLNEIYFQVTRVSDSSIDLLAEIPNINMLCLHETDVTDAGAKNLRTRMPLTEVDHRKAGLR